MELGAYNELIVLRHIRHGLILGDSEGEEILLPVKYVPESAVEGDTLRVFCYLDHEQRPVATTLQPLITRNAFGFLEVAEVNDFGAFLNWGLEKHLLVPFREQPERMKAGQRYVVYCYLDLVSSRLVASARIERFLDNADAEFAPGQEVDLLIYRETELGFEAVINDRSKGLVFRDQVHRKLAPGDRLKGYIKDVRPDHKIDLVLEPPGYRKLEPAAERIFLELERSGGSLPLTDKSSPEEIRNRLQMSKKLFKKGVGILYKERRIELREDGIHIR